MRRVRRIILVLGMLAVLVSVAGVAAATNITLDGDFSDWSGETPLGTDPNESGIPDQYDIGNAYAAVSDSGLQHFIAFTTLASIRINPASAVNVWYDTDANAATGYALGPIGAERQLAWRMDTDTCELSAWDDANGEWDLLATNCDGAPSGIGPDKGTFAELGSDTAHLGLGGTGKLDICMLFENADFGGYEDDTVCFTHEWGNGGGEGCTPGYWKQSQHFDSWVTPPYYPNSTYFDELFGVGPNVTLLEALGTGGGGAKALGRHAVAALLNAAANSGVSYYYSTADVIQMVQDAYATGDFEGIKDLFEYENELGCPLDGVIQE